MRFSVFLGLGMFAATSIVTATSLPGYQQQFILQYADAKSAEASRLVLRPLPRRYTLAFSARWDDTNPKGHTNTLNIMAKHGAKGTFFLTHYDFSGFVEQAKAKGCSIGLHTLSHPWLPALCPNVQFRQYMRNRVELEIGSQTPVVTQVLPFCAYSSPVPYTQTDLGKVLSAVGVIGAPEVHYPNFARRVGISEKEIALSRILQPGDQNIDRKKFDASFAAVLKNADSMKAHPSLSIAMHSWHTPAGLVELEKIFASRAGNPDWWYCNQNEYAAYRYDFHHANPSRKVEGNRVCWTVTRTRPENAGAQLSLWFETAGPQPVKAEGANLKDGLVELPSDSAYPLPAVYDLAKTDGRCPRIAFLRLKLTRREATRWELEIQNDSGKKLDDLITTFYFPPQWKLPAIHVASPSTSEKNLSIAARQPEAASSHPRFARGREYYVAALNFSCDGKRYRVYAELLAQTPPHPVTTLADHARIFCPIPLNADLTELSKPGTALKFTGAEEYPTVQNLNLALGYINDNSAAPKKWAEKKEKHFPFAAIMDFQSDVETIREITCNSKTMWCNGVKLPQPSQKFVWQIPVRKGNNRLTVAGTLGNAELFVVPNF